ncbi:MAG: hypothetical protein RSO15_10490 [Bacteroides sp.]|uniref:hypothetical protein n=1 Tax=Bacteroides sp. TaxID=29523 RepID=UPI002FC61D93
MFIFVELINITLIMPKKLRTTPIYIAPDIIGYLDENSSAIVKDERNENRILNVSNICDKIEIYERQVKEWFLLPAEKMLNEEEYNGKFAALMICLSYIEGVEQYVRGERSCGNSKRFFTTGMKRITQCRLDDSQLEELYGEARCGLFHDGMTRKQMILDNSLSQSIRFTSDFIKINPRRLFEEIKSDFDNYLDKLRCEENTEYRGNFDNLYTLI